jgi:predicted nucleic-acid-binding Zn-ribbon protein
MWSISKCDAMKWEHKTIIAFTVKMSAHIFDVSLIGQHLLHWSECRFISFYSVEDSSAFANTTPVFHYKRRLLTRYVLVIEDTRDMLIRESWTFLRSAIRKWVGHDLPANTEVGIVLSNDTTGHRLLPLSPLSTHARSQVSGTIPFTPGDSHTEACLRCGIRQALDVSV